MLIAQVRGLEDVEFKAHCWFKVAAAAPIPAEFFDNVPPGIDRFAYETLVRLFLAYRFLEYSVDGHIPVTKADSFSHWVNHSIAIINGLQIPQILPTSPLGNAATAVTVYIIQHAGTANMPNTIFKLVESASRVLECHYYPHMSFALPSYGRCSICVPNTSSHATKYRICLRLCDFSSCLSCNRMHFTESQCGMYGRQSTAGTHAGKAKVCATSRDDHTA